jgi:hypothetical protein
MMERRSIKAGCEKWRRASVAVRAFGLSALLPPPRQPSAAGSRLRLGFGHHIYTTFHAVPITFVHRAVPSTPDLVTTLLGVGAGMPPNLPASSPPGLPADQSKTRIWTHFQTEHHALHRFCLNVGLRLLIGQVLHSSFALYGFLFGKEERSSPPKRQTVTV